MCNLVRLSESALLGLHSMAVLARQGEGHLSSDEIAALAGASEHTLAKVLQRLARVGLVRSARGPHGGFVLARTAEEIRLIDIYEAIDGPLLQAHCLLGRARGNRQACILGDLVQAIQQQVRDSFAETSLAQLAASL